MSERLPNPEELDSLFRAHAITRRQFVAGLAALGVTACGLEHLFGSGVVPVSAQTEPSRYLVVIVLDGFRPDYAQLAPMPALDALMAEGTSYDRAWVGQLESETPTGHATLTSGAMPKHTGILGFEWRDPRSKLEALDGWPKGVIAGDLERDGRVHGTSSIPLAVKAADPTARVVSLSSEKVYAADAMGGWAADYILYHQRTGPNKQTLLPAAVPGHVPPADFFSNPNLSLQMPMKHFTDWDYLSAMLALASLEAFQPTALMVNMPGTDVYGHPYGGPATPAVMSQVVAGMDRNLDRIVQAYKKAGIYDQTLFVITADHGMVPNYRSVPGAVTVDAVRRQGGDYYFHTGGTAAYIYMHTPWKRRNAIALTMAATPGVAGAYVQLDPHGQYEYTRAPGSRINPALDAAYRYLLGTFSGAQAPDVVAAFRENTIGEPAKTAHGDHGGLNWGAQHIPLVLAGPGVRPGVLSHAPARLMDVAPTVLRLLGLPSVNMDGLVLADALQNATADDIAAQRSLMNSLWSHQDALMQQAAENLAEDQKLGLKPPPSALSRP